MATLVANNGEAVAERIELQPGINTIGRAEGNHHVLPHGSVSSRHCEIILDGAITIRDLGSTNGTFVDGRAVQEATLQDGQRVTIGHLDFLLKAAEIGAAARGPLRVNVPKAVSTVEAAEAPRTMITADEAISSINVAELEEPSFYRQLPGAFAYPFTRSGMLLLALGTVFFLILEYAALLTLFFRAAINVFTLGFLFAYMQRIISCSAQGEDEVPDFPDVSEIWSDIIFPFLLFVGTFVVTLAPLFAVIVLMREQPLFIPAVIGTGFFCLLYFPMALLAVAVTDNFMALSPHVVVPSIIRIFPAYAVAWLVLLFLAAAGWGTSLGLALLPIPVLPQVIYGAISLFIVMVQMRILGLLFRSYRPHLGWL